MKTSPLICVLATVLIAPPVYARSVKSRSTKKNEYLPGTVLRVQKYQEDSDSNYVGDTASDAPLRSEVFGYDVSIRVNCATYVGRWKSSFDSVPAVFSPNRTVQVRLEKHLMYVDVPGEKEFRMGYVERPRDPAACSTDQ